MARRLTALVISQKDKMTVRKDGNEGQEAAQQSEGMRLGMMARNYTDERQERTNPARS